MRRCASRRPALNKRFTRSYEHGSVPRGLALRGSTLSSKRDRFEGTTVARRRPFLQAFGYAFGVVALALLAAGCAEHDYPQSAMSPHSDYARMIQKLLEQQIYWVVIIFVLVQALLLVAAIRFRSKPGAPDPKPIHGNTVLEIAWTVAPAVILALVAVPT